jgi:hypothetical protein
MDEQNHPNHPGEEPYYSQPPGTQAGKITGPGSRSQSQRLLRVFIGIIAILLVVVIVFGFVIVRLLTTSSQNVTTDVVLATPTTGTIPSQAGATTTTSAPASSPTPASPPAIGTVLCQPKASDWPQTSDWQTVGTEYVHKNGNSIPVIAPCKIPVSDYYVEANIRTSQKDYGALMGVLVRLNLEKKVGYKGGISYATFCGENCGQAELDDILNSQRNTANFGTLSPNTVYTVKLQMKGTDVTLYVNNNLVIEQHYTSANDAGQVGLECDQTCEVLQFTVVAQ